MSVDLEWPVLRGCAEGLFLGFTRRLDAGARGRGAVTGDGYRGVYCVEMSTLEGKGRTPQGWAMVKISDVKSLGR